MTPGEYLRDHVAATNDHSPFTAIDHVQLAMPPGQEQEQAARSFYAGVLGMREIPKPTELAARGGCWFESGSVQIHLGVDKNFRPAKKAHPALRCANYDALLSMLRASGIAVHDIADTPGVPLPHSRLLW
jgi:catechol 2,3-dioxygenase-like lactoylglutathione lyase family enzyme